MRGCLGPDLLLDTEVTEISIARWFVMCARGVFAVHRYLVITMLLIPRLDRQSAAAAPAGPDPMMTTSVCTRVSMPNVGVQMMMMKSKVEEVGPYEVLRRLQIIGFSAVDVSQIPMTPENVAEMLRAK